MPPEGKHFKEFLSLTCLTHYCLTGTFLPAVPKY